MSSSSGMIAVKQKVSKEISRHVEEFLAKGNEILVLDGGKNDTNYKPAKENVSYAF